MHFIDPHIHIASRTTDDLQALARAGCLVVGSRPSGWDTIVAAPAASMIISVN